MPCRRQPREPEPGRDHRPVVALEWGPPALVPSVSPSERHVGGAKSVRFWRGPAAKAGLNPPESGEIRAGKGIDESRNRDAPFRSIRMEAVVALPAGAPAGGLHFDHR